MTKKKEELKPFIFNLSRGQHPEPKIKALINIKGPWAGVDLRHQDVDLFPELTKALDRGGWPEGIKHIRKRIWRK